MTKEVYFSPWYPVIINVFDTRFCFFKLHQQQLSKKYSPPSKEQLSRVCTTSRLQCQLRSRLTLKQLSVSRCSKRCTQTACYRHHQKFQMRGMRDFDRASVSEPKTPGPVVPTPKTQKGKPENATGLDPSEVGARERQHNIFLIMATLGTW